MTVGRAVEAVVFDWGGTLTPWHTIDHHEQWLAYTCEYEPARADELAALLAAGEGDIWRRAREHRTSATMDDLLRSVGIEPTGPGHERALASYHAFWEPHTWTDPDVPALLRGLRDRGVRVGVLSNTIWTREYHEFVFARDGVLDLIDGAVYSSEIPYTKPHPRAFRAALDAVGVDEPARAVFVGDRPYDDVHGAKELGMRAILLPHSTFRPDEHGPVDGNPDAVVQRLADILDLVDTWRALPR